MPEEKIRPRTAFKHFISYLHEKVLDFEQIEKDEMLETYFYAMKFVGEAAGNQAYSPFYKEDAEMMVAIQNKAMSTPELADIMGTSVRSAAPKITKLVNLGYAYTITDKKINYFALTPYGRKKLEELVTDPNSVLYS